MEENSWVDSNFSQELLEFTRANTVERERAVQDARSRGGGQKEADKARKSADRSENKRKSSTNPWQNVVIVKTAQDGKIRLIPSSDFEEGRHELMYGSAPGQPPKPEVTPNVAQEIASQDGFEPSKTSNRLLGVQTRKKRPKEKVVRSDHYDYPKDGVQKTDTDSTYPDWDHSVDSLSQGISLVANSAGGKQVDMNTIRQFFGQSSTLMDASIRAYQQINNSLPVNYQITTPEEAYPTAGPWAELTQGMDTPNTDLIIQTEDGKVLSISNIIDHKKVVLQPEAQVLFNYALGVSVQQIEEEKRAKESLEKLKKKIDDYIASFKKDGSIQKKYLYASGQNFKLEIKSDLESILEHSDSFEETIVVECLTGNEKFGNQIPAAANALMSSAKDGTDLVITPLTQTNIKLLIGETNLKVRFSLGFDESPFDQMYNELIAGQEQQIPQITEFFNIFEGTSEAKVFFDSFMNSQESMLLGLLSFIGATVDTVIVKDINLENIGSISMGDFNKIKVGDRTFYVEVEKPTEYYDSKAIRLGEERDYKKEYREYHGKPEQVKRRQARNGARAKLEKQGRVSPGDGKDVDHKDHNALNNNDKNLRVRDRSSNRGDNKVPVKEEYGAGEEGTDELLLRYLKDTPYMTIPLRLLKGKDTNAARKRKR